MNNFKVWIDTQENLEKINKLEKIGWRGIIGLAKFDEKKENLYINLTAQKEEGNGNKDLDICLIKILIMTEKKEEMSEELKEELIKAFK